jgi:hypothetical protein
MKFRLASLIYRPLLKRLGYFDKFENSSFLFKSHYFEGAHPLRGLIDVHDGYLRESGWLESKNFNSSILNMSPVPWTSYAFLHFLNLLNFKGSNLLEFGGGNSTFYFAKSCLAVRTVEFDAKYVIGLKNGARLHSNITVIDGSSDSFVNNVIDLPIEFSAILEKAYRFDLLMGTMTKELGYDFKKYCSAALLEIERSDVCFIDGGYRNLQLTLFAISKDKPLLIVDNVDFENLAYGLELLRNCDLLEIPFHGLGPLNPYASTTSIFSDPNPESKSNLFRFQKQH